MVVEGGGRGGEGGDVLSLETGGCVFPGVVRLTGSNPQRQSGVDRESQRI